MVKLVDHTKGVYLVNSLFLKERDSELVIEVVYVDQHKNEQRLIEKNKDFKTFNYQVAKDHVGEVAIMDVPNRMLHLSELAFLALNEDYHCHIPNPFLNGYHKVVV